MTDVFPARALGRAEYWGRTVERSLTALEKAKNQVSGSLDGLNRFHAASAEELGRRVVRLDDRLERIEAAFNLLPRSDTAAASQGNFSLAAGWNTVAQTTLQFPTGKSEAKVFVRGVADIADYGTAAPGGEGGFRWPFTLDTVSSEYGPRTGGAGSFHEGIDLAPGAGEAIRVINDGVVESAYFHSSFGNMAIINHGQHNGQTVRSLYAHMTTPALIGVGGQVYRGNSVIGYVGNTGASFGAHLHLEIHVGPSIVWNTSDNGGYRSAVNPRDFMAANSEGAGGGIAFSGMPSSRILIGGEASPNFGSIRRLTTVPADRIYNSTYAIHGRTFTGAGNVTLSLQILAAEPFAANGEMSATLVAFGVFT